MKNIHVLPTDKPSRLYKFEDKLIKNDLIGLYDYKEKGYIAQNIYITSDEEIKEGDWYLELNEIHKFKLGCFTDINSKKIILTTDQDLIGVQAIDDEFLEWFVKNPSCEEVEVEDYGNLYNFRYLILIPKEEPKQVELLGGIEKGKRYVVVGEPKQETLEEEMGKKVAEYCKQYAGTDKYDVAMLAIEFGYNLNLD